MAGLCWMVVVLAFFLYGSVAAEEQNNIDLGDTLNIPQDQDKNDLQQVSKDDPEGQVTQGPGLGTGQEMGEDTGTQITIGEGGKGGKVKRKGGGKRKKGGKGKRKGGGKRKKGGKGKRKGGSKRRNGRKGKRRGKRSAEGNSESDG